MIVVKELRASVSGGQPGDVVTAANPESLIEHLRENHKSVDPDYTEVSLKPHASSCLLLILLSYLSWGCLIS